MISPFTISMSTCLKLGQTTVANRCRHRPVQRSFLPSLARTSSNPYFRFVCVDMSSPKHFYSSNDVTLLFLFTIDFVEVMFRQGGIMCLMQM